MQRYNIYCKDKKIRSNLTEEEYFDAMEDMSIEYYNTGIPHPNDLRTEIYEEHFTTGE